VQVFSLAELSSIHNRSSNGANRESMEQNVLYSGPSKRCLRLSHSVRAGWIRCGDDRGVDPTATCRRLRLLTQLLESNRQLRACLCSVALDNAGWHAAHHRTRCDVTGYHSSGRNHGI